MCLHDEVEQVQSPQCALESPVELSHSHSSVFGDVLLIVIQFFVAEGRGGRDGGVEDGHGEGGMEGEEERERGRERVSNEIL